MGVTAVSEIESSQEEVLLVALLVLRQPLDQELLAQLEQMGIGTESSEKAEAAEQEASVHILASLPMLLLQEEEARLILETLQSTGSEPALLPIRLTLAPQTSCLVVRVELEQLL
jgi:hypothetical protein